ncbi:MULTISPECIES: membrane or secreted protein [Pirellulaceae]|uniref:Membrane protein YqaA with SNARE-associated domain n=1 Tax=Aporhodopirellula rubra TaxID=980271 RepID=A0A7W5DXW4_9BACT|nr:MULTISPECIES: membrane or secreted protein [Pirellulaceae]EMI46639.1 membrane or secreted protein [Rhodopirellula sp. SWK7]MBB3206546.1 membrane protein YqaA with SNARE-associated domain [Aporhodopirellula rubra]
MPAIDLLLFASLALVIGVVSGWSMGYRAGKAKGDADGEARRQDAENRLKELQHQTKELLGMRDED